jgi:sterol desaturase/sphingolipid hydroxylase (fatty acid hydroxylase superfamily)
MIGLSLSLFFFAGAIAWSLTEYGLHRGYGHRKTRLRFSKEHLAHHKNTDSFAPTSHKVQAAVAVSVVLAPVATCLLGWIGGAAFTVGFVLAYVSYELIHRRMHTHAPGSAYTRLMWRHHFHHHLADPSSNHGVTTPVWDVVFGTYQPVQRVRVPQRKAMGWLCDGSGVVKSRFEEEYVVVAVAR